MTAISTLHNLSRSLGCAIMLAADTEANTNALSMFIAGDYALFFLIKILRRDFFTFYRLDGLIGGVISFAHHLIMKTVVDYSGNFHFRHTYGLGGIYFSLSLVWAQLFPFVAFNFYHGEGSGEFFSNPAAQIHNITSTNHNLPNPSLFI